MDLQPRPLSTASPLPVESPFRKHPNNDNGLIITLELSQGCDERPASPKAASRCSYPVKLRAFDKLSTEEILKTLAPGQECCLKARPDGTILDGHHRVEILRSRSVLVDLLSREVLNKEDGDDR